MTAQVQHRCGWTPGIQTLHGRRGTGHSGLVWCGGWSLLFVFRSLRRVRQTAILVIARGDSEDNCHGVFVHLYHSTCCLAVCFSVCRHGGRQCAEFVHARLHHCFRHQLFLLTGRLGLTTSIYRAVYDALFRAFTHTDRIFLRQQEQQNRRSGPGCAAIVVVILGDTLWAANAGDARAVLCRNGAALSLSRDHKPVRQK